MFRRTRPSVVVLACLLSFVGSSSAMALPGAGGVSARAGVRVSGRVAGAPAPRANGVKFAECVRAHGVPHVPDPDAKGDFNFGVDVTPTVFTRAVSACKRLQPPGSLSSRLNPRQLSAALRFAQCARAHGVKDFPDPVNGQPLINTYKIPSSNKPGGMTILNAAIRACGAILKLAAGGQG
jgi:hypothetical protein